MFFLFAQRAIYQLSWQWAYLASWLMIYALGGRRGEIAAFYRLHPFSLFVLSFVFCELFKEFLLKLWYIWRAAARIVTFYSCQFCPTFLLHFPFLLRCFEMRKQWKGDPQQGNFCLWTLLQLILLAPSEAIYVAMCQDWSSTQQFPLGPMHCNATRVGQSRNYSIDATESSSHNSYVN